MTMELFHKIVLYACFCMILLLACVCNVNYYRDDIVDNKIEEQNRKIDSLNIVINELKKDTLVVKTINIK